MYHSWCSPPLVPFKLVLVAEATTKKVCDKLCDNEVVWQNVTKMVRSVWQRWCVTKKVCDKLCDKDGVWQRGADGSADKKEAEEPGGTDLKTRTLHKHVGEKQQSKMDDGGVLLYFRNPNADFNSNDHMILN